MSTDKRATILEAQWMEQEIPRIQAELASLQKLEQELLTTPLETVNQAYTTAFRASRRRARIFYHRRRSVTPTRYGYRERMLDAGWLTAISRVLIAAAIVAAVYVAYRYNQLGDTRRGIIWGSVLLVTAIFLSVAPILGDFLLERRARRLAKRAAQEVRQTEAFLQERNERQTQLKQSRARTAELEERLKFAHVRLDELRKELTSTDHQDELPSFSET
jgi:hypothetical protein